MNNPPPDALNILLITKNFNMGGAEDHVCELANELTNRGYNVYLVAKQGMQSLYLSGKVKFFPLAISDLRFLPNLIKLYNLVRREKIQVVHGHQRLGISLAVWLSKLANIPNVATIHGQLKYDIRSSLIRNRVDRLICVRKVTFEQAKKSKRLSSRTSLILNGVIVHPYSYEKQPYTLMYGSRIDKRHFSVIAMVIKDVMPELLDIYPKAKFVIYGQGTHAEELNSLIKTQRTTRHAIDYRGYTNKLGAHYQEASLALGCARSAMDALCNGTNVLPVNVHAIGEIVTESSLSHFMSNNFEPINYEAPTSGMILELIKHYFDNYDIYDKQLSNLKEKAKRHISLKSAVDKVEKLYLEVTTQPLI
jgi:glycosyltransferase involved in cell wall biosynthesis